MAVIGYPFENQRTTESQYANVMGGAQRWPGVLGYPGGPHLQGSTPGGLVVRFTAGLAWANGYVLDHDGATAGRDVTVSAADVSQARVDRIVARLDPITNSATLTHLPGTPGSTVPPALTRTPNGVYDVKLYRFTVGAGATGFPPGALIDERDWSGVSLGRWTTANRPTAAGPLELVGLNLDTGRIEVDSWEVLDTRDARRTGQTYVDQVTVPAGGAPGAPVVTLATTVRAGAVTVRCTGWVENANSGAPRQVEFEMQQDGARTGPRVRLNLPHEAGLAPGQALDLTGVLTATAGPHTYRLLGAASADAAVQVKGLRLWIEQGE